MRWDLTPLAPVAAAFAIGIATQVAPPDPGGAPPPLAVWIAWASAALAAATLLALGRDRAATVAVLAAVGAAGALHAGAHARPPHHVALLRLPASVRIEGHLVAEPVLLRPERARLLLQADAVAEAGLRRVATGLVQLTVYGPLPGAPTEGQRVSLDARLSAPRGFRNPGGFDHAGHLARQDIGVVGSSRSERVAVLSGALPPWYVRTRQWAREQIRSVLPPVSAALLAGLLLGDRADLPPALHDAFRVAGVYHILAVSGFNVALLTSGVFGILAVARIPRRGGAVIAIGTAIGFALIVGGGASVLRATVMAVLVLAAVVLGRASSLLNSVALAALVILALRPGDLAEPGFQLSFGATLGILGFAAPIQSGLSTLRCPRWLAGAAGVSLAAQLPITPILLHHFNQLSLIAVVANLLVVPLAALATVAGALALVLAAISTLVSRALLDGLWPVLLALRAVVFLAARVPSAMLHLPAPHWAATLLFYSGLAALAAASALAAAARPGTAGPVAHPEPGTGARKRAARSGRTLERTRPWDFGRAAEPADPGMTACGAGARAAERRSRASRVEQSAPRPRFAGGFPLARRALGSLRPGPRGVATILLAAAALGEVWPLVRPPEGRLRVTVLDVGQGDAIAIEFPDGRAALVDAGTGGPSGFDVGERVVAPYLWNRGVRRLATVVETHGHLDHAGGIPAVLRHFGPGQFWSPDHEPPTSPVYLAGVGVTALGPPRPRLTGSARGPGADHNNDSVVLRLDYGLASFLLTADIEDAAERRLLARGAPLRAHVLKVAHHGSRTSTGARFLERVSPSIAIISVGARNPFGHPADATLHRLGRAGARLYRTDRDGAVIVETDGRELAITRWSDRHTERIALRYPPRARAD